MKKKFVIKIKTPADASLDKVRVHISLDKETVWAEENIAYDDVVIPEVKLDFLEDKKQHHFAVEYYSSTSEKVLRPVQPIPRTIINDMGPWELLGEDKIQQGDERLGVLETTQGSPAYPYIPLECDFSRAWAAAMAKIGSSYATGNAALYVNNPTYTMLAACTDGEIYLAPNNIPTSTISTAPASFYTFLRDFYSLSVEDRRFEVNGFIWEIDYMFSDIAEKWIDYASVNVGSYYQRFSGYAPVTHSGLTSRISASSSYAYFPVREELETYSVETIRDEETNEIIQQPTLTNQPFRMFSHNTFNNLDQEYYTSFIKTAMTNSNIYFFPLARYIGPA